MIGLWVLVVIAASVPAWGAQHRIVCAPMLTAGSEFYSDCGLGSHPSHPDTVGCVWDDTDLAVAWGSDGRLLPRQPHEHMRLPIFQFINVNTEKMVYIPFWPCTCDGAPITEGQVCGQRFFEERQP